MKKVGVIITPLACELCSSASTRARPRRTLLRGLRVFLVQTHLLGDGTQVVFGQGSGACHQLDMRSPEFVRGACALGQLGGAAGELDAGERTVAKNVAKAIAEAVAHFGDAFVGSAAIGTGVTAVFDERNGRVVGTENVVVGRIDWTIEPVGQHIWPPAVSENKTARALRPARRRVTTKGRSPRSANLQVLRRVVTPVGHHFVLDSLSFIEGRQTGTLDCRDVHEHIAAAVLRLNKPITLRRVEPLYFSARHIGLLVDKAKNCSFPPSRDIRVLGRLERVTHPGSEARLAENFVVHEIVQ
jgi:hypothetical protein